MLEQVKHSSAAVEQSRHRSRWSADAPHLKITGELPRELNGTLYRNGPNPQFDAPGAHWFVGDGMLHAFHLENGRASYRNRWVRTPKWLGRARRRPRAVRRLRPQAAGHAGRVTDDGGVANTNIIFHAGKLLGAGGRPYADRDRARHARTACGYCDYKADASTAPSPRIPRSIP